MVVAVISIVVINVSAVVNVVAVANLVAVVNVVAVANLVAVINVGVDAYLKITKLWFFAFQTLNECYDFDDRQLDFETLCSDLYPQFNL